MADAESVVIPPIVLRLIATGQLISFQAWERELRQEDPHAPIPERLHVKVARGQLPPFLRPTAIRYVRAYGANVLPVTVTFPPPPPGRFGPPGAELPAVLAAVFENRLPPSAGPILTPFEHATLFAFFHDIASMTSEAFLPDEKPEPPGSDRAAEEPPAAPAAPGAPATPADPRVAPVPTPGSDERPLDELTPKERQARFLKKAADYFAAMPEPDQNIAEACRLAARDVPNAYPGGDHPSVRDVPRSAYRALQKHLKTHP